MSSHIYDHTFTYFIFSKNNPQKKLKSVEKTAIMFIETSSFKYVPYKLWEKLLSWLIKLLNMITRKIHFS